MSQPDPQEALAKRDTILASVIRSTPFPAFNNTHDVFEDLASCILDMRIHYAGSNAAFRYKLLKRLLENERITPETILDLPQRILAPLKLSHQKEESLHIWATKWLDDKMDAIDWHSLSATEVREHLSGIRGVGDWSKQMILLFTLEHPDIFPESDYQLTKAMCQLYALEDNNELRENRTRIAAHWSPHTSLAVRYLWRWRETNKRTAGAP